MNVQDVAIPSTCISAARVDGNHLEQRFSTRLRIMHFCSLDQLLRSAPSEIDQRLLNNKGTHDTKGENVFRV